MTADSAFDPDCKRCPRLAGHLSDVRAAYPDYHARPVAPFGDGQARILIVGLAPGMHGANASGRPFTGDHAGILLYQTLYDKGLSNRPRSTSAADDLQLSDCRITNAVKCLPPQNKPTGREVATCNPYLAVELAGLPEPSVICALGRIAHQAVARALSLRQGEVPFSHGAVHAIGANRWLLDSYHCSRYNTQTRRLTPSMFSEVFDRALDLLQGA